MTNNENERLLATLKKMEENKVKVDNAYLAGVHKNFKIIQQLEKYEDQSLIVQILAEAKKKIWYNINANITELKLPPSINMQDLLTPRESITLSY